MALKISLSTFISGGFTNPVRWDLRETGTGVLIDSHSEAGPHGVIYNFSFVNNIRDIVYTILLYDVPGGVGLGNLIKSHDVTVSTSTIQFDADIELIVNGGQSYDPVGGSSSVIIPRLIGLGVGDYSVFERGIGQLLQTRAIEIIPDVVNGGFALTGGRVFNTPGSDEDGDIFVVAIKPKYVINPAGSQGASTIYKDVVIVTVDQAIISSDMGKLLIVDGVNPVITLTLDAAANLIEKVPLWIESVGSTHLSLVIKAAFGETIIAAGLSNQKFILGRGVRAQVMVIGGAIYGFTDDPDIKRAGQLDWAYSLGVNRLWANGAEYLVANYPRIKLAMDLMEVGTVQSYATWNSSIVVNTITLYPYKGYYALSGDGSNFKVPDLRDQTIRGLRYSDATVDGERLSQGPGGFQNELTAAHFHYMFVNSGSSDALTLASQTTARARTGSSASENYDMKGFDNTGNIRPPTIGQTSSQGGASQRNRNIGLIPQIII